MTRRRRVSLRTKLALILAAMAVIPCVILTAVVSTQLVKAIDFWSNPGLEQTFAGSMTAARETMRVLETRLVEAVKVAAQDPLTPPSGLDVWRVYRRTSDGFELEAAEASDAGTLIDGAAIEQALRASERHIIEHPDGWLLAVAIADPDGQRVCVGGYRVGQELFTSVAQARQGARLFGRLDPYRALSAGWVWVSLAAVATLILAVAVILARRLARGVTRPIEELVRAMGQLGRGEAVIALEPPRDREMGYLVQSFNSMSAELERSRRQLKRAERLSAWRDVARRVAHEIKNPLTPIQFAIHRLQKELGGELVDRDKVRGSLDSILGEVETLRSMADTFSELAKLPDPRFEEVRADSLLREVLTLYQQPSVRHELRIASDLPSIRADRKQLRQVLNNLVQNATEAMPGGGTLTVRARVVNGSIVIEILDTGAGIPEHLLDSIWEPYFTTKRGGSGIGLAVVSKIVHDHGGSIELENRPEGGAAARLRLPAGTAGLAAADATTPDSAAVEAENEPGLAGKR